MKSWLGAFGLLKRATLRDGRAVETSQPIIRLHTHKSGERALWEKFISG
jgi:hypothetical protein